MEVEEFKEEDFVLAGAGAKNATKAVVTKTKIQKKRKAERRNKKKGKRKK